MVRQRLAPYIPAGPLAENLPELPAQSDSGTGSTSHAATSNDKAIKPKAVGPIDDPALYDVLNEIYERVHRLHVLVNEVFDDGLLVRLNRAEHNIQVMQNAVNGMEQALPSCSISNNKRNGVCDVKCFVSAERSRIHPRTPLPAN